jgi:hypothetical protein
MYSNGSEKTTVNYQIFYYYLFLVFGGFYCAEDHSLGLVHARQMFYY